MNTSEHAPLLQVKDLVKHFPIRGGILGREVDRVHAVDGVSFDLAAGETLGVVGESGCGKSTTGRCILRLIEPTSGEVWFEGKNVTAAGKDELRALARDMQIIFQDPYASLNPRMTVGSIVGEALTIHKLAQNPRQYEDRIVELLETVGLSADHMRRFPHEFSGGQRQRIGIARALAVSPKLVVCDEAVSALDVSIQAQVINLLEDLRSQFSLTYIFIAHDLSVVEHISHRVAVMYLGRIVELAPAKALYTNPKHPYTEALLSAVPIPDPSIKRKRVPLQGDVPSPIHPPSGCHFHTRCPIAVKPLCSTEKPLLKQTDAGHWVACHFSKLACCCNERPSCGRRATGRGRRLSGWLPLWNGYNAFYGRHGETALPDEVTTMAWRRFFDPTGADVRAGRHARRAGGGPGPLPVSPQHNAH
jgi:oligopeptide transport system ATP-binding protein